MRVHRFSRKVHRFIVPIVVAPLILVAFSGALYGTLINFNVEWIWLLKMHTGNFGVINLQPFYSPVLGVLTFLAAMSGIFLLFPRRHTVKHN